MEPNKLLLIFYIDEVIVAPDDNKTNPATCSLRDQGLQSSMTDKLSDSIQFNVLKCGTTMS